MNKFQYKLFEESDGRKFSFPGNPEVESRRLTLGMYWKIQDKDEAKGRSEEGYDMPEYYRIYFPFTFWAEKGSEFYNKTPTIGVAVNYVKHHFNMLRTILLRQNPRRWYDSRGNLSDLSSIDFDDLAQYVTMLTPQVEYIPLSELSVLGDYKYMLYQSAKLFEQLCDSGFAYDIDLLCPFRKKEWSPVFGQPFDTMEDIENWLDDDNVSPMKAATDEPLKRDAK